MINTINHVKNLPNQDGFKFLAVLKDGTIQYDIVRKGANGLHTITDYKNTIGWLPLSTIGE